MNTLQAVLPNGKISTYPGERLSVGMGYIKVGGEFYLLALTTGTIIIGPYPTKYLLRKALAIVKGNSFLRFGFFTHEAMWDHAKGQDNFVHQLNQVDKEIL